MLVGGAVVVFGSLTNEQGVVVFLISFILLAVFLSISARRAYVAASAELVAEQAEEDSGPR
jgi:hypothetical protein